MLQVVLPLQVLYFAAKGLTASGLFGCKWSLHVVLPSVSFLTANDLLEVVELQVTKKKLQFV